MFEQAGRPGKATNQKPGMNAPGKSDGCVLPVKPPNKGGVEAPSAEGVEGRQPTKGNARQTAAPRTQSRDSASTDLARVRDAARRDRRARFTALLHHVSLGRLRTSFYALKRAAAPGVDGVTWAQYEVGLDDRLRDLHGQVHQGSYRAMPSKRTYIPKADERQRPLGLAALEDKIVQHALAEVLTPIYEADFKGFSYGFRPGRNQHHALDALWMGLMGKKVNWVLDADIR
ncbi:MAG: group II intron reverse transcriptase/maturase, partial [Gemmatimonadales bacterium]